MVAMSQLHCVHDVSAASFCIVNNFSTFCLQAANNWSGQRNLCVTVQFGRDAALLVGSMGMGSAKAMEENSNPKDTLIDHVTQTSKREKTKLH